jgi:predicted extracellular nuclease
MMQGAGMVFKINEIVVSTTGADREFIELFGPPGASLEGVSLLQVLPGGEISSVVDFSGRIGVNGHYLAASPEAEDFLGVTGNQQITNNTFSNSSRTYLLVQGFTGAVGDDIDFNDDGSVDIAPWAFIHDSVAPIDDDSPLIYSPNVIGPDGSFLSPGGYRDPVGTGSFVQHDFFDSALYSPTAGSDVLINEIVVSTTGADREFLELVGLPGTDLSGMSILEIEPGGEIDTIISLTGSIQGNGYYLLASSTAESVLGVVGDQSISDNSFSNGSRTYLLVDGFTGASGNDIDTNNDGVIDTVLWTGILDSVAPIDDDSPLIYSTNIIGPDGSFLSPGGYRDPAAFGTFVQHDFFNADLYTPTASAPFAINEIAVSTTGTDAEFLEIIGEASADLSAYSILEIEPGGEIDSVINLTGSTGENGYYLLASPEAQSEFFVIADQEIANNTFSNGSRTYLMVENFTGASGEDIDADDDGVIDNVLWSSIADSVAPIDDDNPLIYSGNIVGPDGAFLAAGGYRNPERVGAFVMHDFFDLTSYTPQSGNGLVPLVINEIVVSTTGVDTEFLELLGTPGTDLSGYSILEVEPGGEIDSVINLTGSTGENGYYLLASPEAQDELFVIADQEIADNTFSNGSRTYLLVQGFTGASGDDIDADNNGFIDNVLWSDITDSVAPIDDDSPLIYSGNIVGPDGSFLAAGGYRDPEGRGNFVMHDFFDVASYTPQSGNELVPLVINEIVVSTTGADTEFLELFGTPGADLSAFSILEVRNGGEVDAIIDLSGTVGDNGYFLLTSPEAVSRLGVIGNQIIANNSFSNSSQTYLLVENFTGTSGDDIDADDNGIIDNVLWSDIADSVAVIDDDSPRIYSSNVVGPDGAFLAAGGYRDPEGNGDFVMHDFFDPAIFTPTVGTFAPTLAINEIVVSTTGADREFLELLGTPGASLDDLTLLEVRNGGQIGDVISLSGQQLGDNGYFLLASPQAEVDLGVTANLAIANNTFSNLSQTYLLVENFTGASGDDIDADDNGVIDGGLWSGIIDSVAVIDDDSPLIYSNNVVGPDGAFLAAGGYRNPMGTGEFFMHDFFDPAVYTPTEGTGETSGGGEPTFELISVIQGSGAASALVGATVTVEAIVVGDFQNGDGDALRNLGGFYLQEESADQDSDAATSEGLFIFDDGLGMDVSLGDRVQVTGTVSEFQGQTQINAASVSIVEAGAVADVNTMAVSVSLDAVSDVVVDGSGNYAPDMEAFEGMLANFTDTLTVNEMFQLDRFNEIRVSANGRPEQFTQLFDPDPAAFDAYQREKASDQIIFDDGLNIQNAAILPEADLNGDGDFDTADGFTMGDTITGLTGIVTWGWAGNSASDNSWRVRSVDDGNSFTDSNTREATPPDVGGTITVASFNVLNFFTTLDEAGNPGSGPSLLPPRGADNLEEFDRQLDKLVTSLLAMDADIFGLVELENEFGTDQNGDGLVAINFLVEELNARIGSVTYAAVDIGRGFVDVSDAISVGMIYNVNTVSVVANSVEILNDEDLAALPGTYSDPVFDGANTNRAPLAATFVDIASGEDFTVAVTHMKSKGGSGTGDDADQGDGAGAFNEMRTQGVQAVTEWLDSFADEDRLVLGDFNAYMQEDPIDTILASDYTDLAATYAPGLSSYVFDSKTGTLDYAFGSAGIMDNVTGATSWTINSDEPDALDYNTDFGRDPAIFDGTVPFRSSDHDPILVGLEFAPEILVVEGTEGNDELVGSDAAERFISLGGRIDRMTGGGGEDEFVFGAELNNNLRERDIIYDYGVDDTIILASDNYTLSTIRNGMLMRHGDDGDLIYVLGAGIDEHALTIEIDTGLIV